MRVLLLFLLLNQSDSLVLRASKVHRGCLIKSDNMLNRSGRESQITNLKGGSTMTLLPIGVKNALQRGALGVPTLGVVALSIVAPLTALREAYSFSVGYGASVMVMSLTLMHTFGVEFSPMKPSTGLALATTVYGARLAIHLLVREYTVESVSSRVKSFDKTPLLKRVPLVFSVALFYACMISPLLYAFRNPVETVGPLYTTALFGTGLAWAGVIVEAVGDTHKYLLKARSDDDGIFRGPIGGLFAISRHANYLGELMFWYGLMVGGLPSFGASPTPYICSLIGIAGITFIMLGATRRLEEKQLRNYGGQASYDEWVASSSALWPNFFLSKAGKRVADKHL